MCGLGLQETEIGAALCTTGVGRTLTFDVDFFTINLLKSKGFQRYLEEDIDQIFLGQLIWQDHGFLLGLQEKYLDIFSSACL